MQMQKTVRQRSYYSFGQSGFTGIRNKILLLAGNGILFAIIIPVHMASGWVFLRMGF
jgi:hypothetical protein